MKLFLFQISRIELSNSQQYYLEIQSDLAKNHPRLKETVVGLEVGECEIYLRDLNGKITIQANRIDTMINNICLFLKVGKEDAVKSPSADLHVVA